MKSPPKLTDEEIDYIVNHNTKFYEIDDGHGGIIHKARMMFRGIDFDDSTNYGAMASLKEELGPVPFEDEEGYAVVEDYIWEAWSCSFEPVTEHHLTQFVKYGRLPDYVDELDERRREYEQTISQDSETVPLHS